MKSKLLLFILIFLGLDIYSHAQPVFPDWNDGTKTELPYDRYIQPAGKQIVFGDPALENHALDCALSPDGLWLAIEARHGIEVYSTTAGKIVYEFMMKDFPGVHDLMNCYSGISWNNIGNRTYILWTAASNTYKISYVIEAEWKGTFAEISGYFPFRADKPGVNTLANEFLINEESGTRYLYTVLNGSDKVIKQNYETKDTVWMQPTGVAPYGIVRSNNKLYVTNWGGRVPVPGDINVAVAPWSFARVDSVTGATREGSVTVLDMENGNVIKEIEVGLHPNEIITDRKENYVYVTNSNSDNVSVISTKTDEVAETISVRLDPGNNPYFGDSPNGLTLTRNGKTLFVANGLDNALAVITLGKKASIKGKKPESMVSGFIPTGAYPSSITLSNEHKLYVTNLESEGANVSGLVDSGRVEVYNSHHMWASISEIKIPTKKELESYSKTVIALNQFDRLQQAKLKPRSNVKPVPVPERIGEPSVFKHVLYIIKENRTYDQVLGDVEEGNGNDFLCTYGREVTPNTHRLVKDFTLLDNFYVSGKSSAEGHQWTDASIVSDYVEKNVRAWFRSYPHVQTDALVYSPTGFLWNNAVKHEKSVKIYGEAAIPLFDRALKWKDVYTGFLEGKPFKFENISTISEVRKLLSETYPGYDNHNIPDILRADAFIKELKDYESRAGDQLPELMIMALPNDHTAGLRPDYPSPRAMIADNDVALGRIIEAVTNSKFWENTVIFVVEDDSQDGWDHVSAYRTVGMVISPYSKIDSTIHTRYNQPSIVRTIEQILGIPPMNIQDALANPMFDCFTGKKDLGGYASVPNIIRLDEMNPPMQGLRGKTLKYTRFSMLPEFDHIDSGNDDLFNRILWFAAKENIPYPEKYAGNDEEDEDQDGD